MTMPWRMFATCSVASIASSRRSKMSFQRITTIGSIPVSKSDARLANDSVAVVLEPVQLDGVVRDVTEAAQSRHRLRDLPRSRVQHARQVLGLHHGRLDFVEP